MGGRTGNRSRVLVGGGPLFGSCRRPFCHGGRSPGRVKGHGAERGAGEPCLKSAFGPPGLGSRLARARNRVAPMPHACEQARQTPAGCSGRSDRRTQSRSVKVLLSMEILNFSDVLGPYSFMIASRLL